MIYIIGESVCEWWNQNIYTNIFTLITVLLSGVFSWIISAIYFHIGNRNNLKVSIIYPVKRLLEEEKTYNNYTRLEELLSEYSVKYMRKKERKILENLVNQYKEIYYYNEERINAECLAEYFLDTLEANGVRTKIYPVRIEDEIVDYTTPDDMSDVVRCLEEVFKKLHFCDDELNKTVIDILKLYSKEFFSVEDVDFLTNTTIEKAINSTTKQDEWNKKFKKFDESEKDFLALKIARK